MPVSLSKPIVGVDVAKNELVIYQADGDLLQEIPNTKTSIKQWLKALPGPVAIAVEATNIFHVDFADLAYEAGCTISHRETQSKRGSELAREGASDVSAKHLLNLSV